MPAGTMIDLTSFGAAAQAYVARPKGAPTGAVLVLHEWWGLNDWIKGEADELAGLGYLTVAVDLYGGVVATKPAQASKLMAALDQKNATSVEKAGLAWLAHEAPGAKIATIGWCMGGGQSLQASLADPAHVAATVMYYGMPVDDPKVLATLRGPVLGIFAKRDGWITPAVVAAFDGALTKAGVKHDIHSYDADHAFANPSSGRYQADDARDAWAITVAFLATNLSDP
jgi:carboxymethylenebutenolidase